MWDREQVPEVKVSRPRRCPSPSSREQRRPPRRMCRARGECVYAFPRRCLGRPAWMGGRRAGRAAPGRHRGGWGPGSAQGRERRRLRFRLHHSLGPSVNGRGRKLLEEPVEPLTRPANDDVALSWTSRRPRAWRCHARPRGGTSGQARRGPCARHLLLASLRGSSLDPAPPKGSQAIRRGGCWARRDPLLVAHPTAGSWGTLARLSESTTAPLLPRGRVPPPDLQAPRGNADARLDDGWPIHPAGCSSRDSPAVGCGRRRPAPVGGGRLGSEPERLPVTGGAGGGVSFCCGALRAVTVVWPGGAAEPSGRRGRRR